VFAPLREAKKRIRAIIMEPARGRDQYLGQCAALPVLLADTQPIRSASEPDVAVAFWVRFAKCKSCPSADLGAQEERFARRWFGSAHNLMKAFKRQLKGAACNSDRGMGLGHEAAPV
jgi:hypothetical protein